MSETTGHALDLDAIDTVLIVAVPCIGDTLLATPIASSLLARKPSLQIDFLVQEHCSSLLADCPSVRNVLEYDYRSVVGSYWRMYRQLFRRYDLAISTSASDRPLQAVICAAPRRYSLVPPFKLGSSWKHWAVTRPILRDDSIPVTELNMRLVDQMGLPRVGDFLLPEFNADASPAETALLEGRRRPYAVIHGTPRQTFKEWPMESWADVTRHLIERGLHVYLTGGPGDADARFASDLAARFESGVTSVSGRLGFGGLTQLLRDSEIYVGVDTVTSHIAAATGVPMVVLFGPTNHVKWGPVAKAGLSGTIFDHAGGQRTIDNVTLCKGECICKDNPDLCGEKPGQYSPCLQQMSPSVVIDAIEAQMPGSSAA